MKRDEWTQKQHKRNLGVFKELAIRIGKGLLRIASITIDEPEFGHTRIVIFVEEREHDS